MKSILVIICYNFFPDNVPSSQRPSVFAKTAEKQNVELLICTRLGIFSSYKEAFDAHASCTFNGGVKDRNSLSYKLFILANTGVKYFFTLDKGIVRHFKNFFYLGMKLVKVNKNDKIIVWATSPVPSNHYLALIVSKIFKCKLVLDFRDLWYDKSPKHPPILTLVAIKQADILFAVAPYIVSILKGYSDKRVIYNSNGIYNAELPENENNGMHALNNRDPEFINLSYAGSLYDGERPVLEFINKLKNMMDGCDSNLKIRIKLITREGVSPMLNCNSRNLQVEYIGPLPKKDCIDISKNSDINMVVIGSSEYHMGALPLKLFDLLGVGKPILLVGSKFSAPAKFLNDNSEQIYYSVLPDELDEYDNNFIRFLELAKEAEVVMPHGPFAEHQAKEMIRLLLNSNGV